MARKRINPDVQKNVVLYSKRRCCLCFYLDDDQTQKKGQIAHIDKDKTNDKEENLVWLCFDHHDAYDSSTSQSKNYTASEVKEYRKKLYAFYNPKTYDRQYILNNTKQGGIEDYRKWINGYKATGGRVYHTKRNNFDRLRIVTSKIYLQPFYGIDSVELIVQNEGEIEFLSDNIGHSVLYYMDGFKVSGTSAPEDL